jgi:hypothetical protein
MDLRHRLVLEHFMNHLSGFRSVVHSRVGDPAFFVVRAPHLQTFPPLRGIPAHFDKSTTRQSVSEFGPDLPIRAWRQRWLIAEKAWLEPHGRFAGNT